MINTTLSKRYAKALVEIGKQRNALEAYGRDLTNLCQLVDTSRDLREVLFNPVFTREDKKRIVGEVLKRVNPDPMVTNFINVLIDKKRIDQLAGIEKAYLQAVDQISGITRGEVVGAETLGEDDMKRITDALSQISGKKVLLSARVDPSLIGGLVAKVGDTVLDGSIRTQLNQLRESLRG